MKTLSTNYTAVKSISRDEFNASAEKQYAVGKVNYPKQEVKLFLGKHNTKTEKSPLVYIYFKGKPTFITSPSKLPDSLLVMADNTVSLVETAVLGIEDGNIVL